jgi:transposase
MNKTGPLGEVEKYYIKNMYTELSVEELSKKLNRSLPSVKKYLKKIEEEKPKQKEPKASPARNLFASNKGSTVMTEAASQSVDEARNNVSRESKRAKTCTIKIR